MPGMTTSRTTQSAGWASKLIDRAPAVGSRDHSEACDLQSAAHEQAGTRIVVDDEHGCRRIESDCRFAASDPLAPTPRSASAPAAMHCRNLDIPCGFSAPTGAALAMPPSRTSSSHSLVSVASRRPPRLAVLDLKVCRATCRASTCPLGRGLFDRGDQRRRMLHVQFDHRIQQRRARQRGDISQHGGINQRQQRGPSRRSDSGSTCSASQRFSSAASCCCEKGLLRKSSMPAARQRSRSPSMALAVSAMMGSRAPPAFCSRRRSSASPSIHP